VSTSKSFWSGIPVVAKALGGIATGVVGVGGLLVALGVIGSSNNSNNNSPTATTLVPGSSGGAGSSGGETATTAAKKGSFTLDRTDVALGGLLSKTATVTVTNKGSVALSLTRPDIIGTDKDRFSVVATECTGSDLEPGKSCSMEVTFTSGGAEASATMVVRADNASTSAQVKLKGSLV